MRSSERSQRVSIPYVETFCGCSAFLEGQMPPSPFIRLQGVLPAPVRSHHDFSGLGKRFRFSRRRPAGSLHEQAAEQ